MTTSRSQAPPVNLKERIAALQQRNVSPGPRPISPSAPSPAAPNSAGLRDKIARFEKKGGVPVPRGSFGLGAPPLENGQTKSRELYGNRIPGAVRVSGGGPSASRSGSPFDSRSFSMSALEGHDVDILDAAHDVPSSPSSPSVPATPFQGLTPQHTGARDPRGTPFATLLEHARRVEGHLEASLTPAARESSPAPSIPLTSGPEAEQLEAGDGQLAASFHEPSPPEKLASDKPTQLVSPEAEAPAPCPPSIVLTPTGEVESEQVVSVVIPPAEKPTPEAEARLPSPPSIVLTPTGEVESKQVVSVVISPAEKPSIGPTTTEPVIKPSLDNRDATVDASKGPSGDSSTPTANKPHPAEPAHAAAGPTTEVISVQPITSTHVSTSPSNVANEADPASQKPEVATKRQGEAPASASSAATADSSPLSPMGPFTLANAVHDLGQVVANIHDMFPGQISPLAPAPPYRPFRVETPSQDTTASQEPKTALEAKMSVPDLQIHAPPADAVPIPQSTSRRPAASSTVPPSASGQARNLTTPRSANGRPVSMIETSPSHVAVAHRVTPHTSRGVPVFLPSNRQQGQQNFDHFPPTPEPNVTEFGTVSLHKPSHSFSHARTFVAHGQTAEEDASGKATFSAVVHRKVTEKTPVQSSSYESFYHKVPETPQSNVAQTELPLSPGYGELATLLHEAALLELTLEQGDLPTGAMRQEASERQEKEKEAKEREKEKEKEKEAAARARLEEERKKHEAVAKARSKQESTESKSRSSFRNPLLRSKTSHKRDLSLDSEGSKDSTRSKSVLLPFRPQPAAPSYQTPPSIASIPEKEVAPDMADGDASSHSSPKSPRSYFAGLKRLASSSRSSTASGYHSRNSVSASSEISSEDSLSIPTPPGNGLYSAGSNGSTAESGHGGFFSGSGIAWPSLSPKKSPSLGRAASFADKMWNRGRTKSTVSYNSPYEAIDRLTKSAAAKSAAALIPPLDPMSFSIEVPTLRERELPTPPEELVSPRRSASLYVPSTSQFPPVYSAKPTSPVYTPLPPVSGIPSRNVTQPVGLDAMLSEKLTSPVFTPHPGQGTQHLDALFSAKPTSPVFTPHPGQGAQSMDALFSAKPTSPVYTPHLPAMRSEETITDHFVASPGAESLLPSPQDYTTRPPSWVSDVSMESSTSSLIPSPFFDSFPSVPHETPLPPALPGRQRTFNRPSLPLPPTTPSFFEPALLSTAAVGAEFFSAAPSPYGRSTTVRSATVPRISGEHHR